MLFADNPGERLPVTDASLVVGLAQIAPVWLNRDATLEKVISYVERAAREGCGLVLFGEALVPGYPFWLEWTDGARFNSTFQKTVFAEYAYQAVDVTRGHLDQLRATASRHHIAIYVGCVERAPDRGGHSLYCSLVFINPQGDVDSVHRKLVPTYEERLVWSAGDGHGLRTHRLDPFQVGGLNCWENWMPLPRAALYAQGEDLHVAAWPGGVRNTRDITRFIALEARSYVASVSGLMRKSDIDASSAWGKVIAAASPEVLADGGSCVAAPNGEWVLAPAAPGEELFVVSLDHRRVLEERQNFDPSGHYSRPDVTRLEVSRQRQKVVDLLD